MLLRENVDKMCDEINAKKMDEKKTSAAATIYKMKYVQREIHERLLLKRKRDHEGKAPVDTLHIYIHRYKMVIEIERVPIWIDALCKRKIRYIMVKAGQTYSLKCNKATTTTTTQ